MRCALLLLTSVSLGALSVSARAAGPTTTITLFDNANYPGGWGSSLDANVALPDAAAMQGFDTLTVALTLACPSGQACPPWDFLANLYLCDRADPAQCNTEVARWVTAYGAPGSWTTDISPLLALLTAGGTRTFRFSTPQAYGLTLTLNFSSQGKSARPVAIYPLFQGGNLDTSYNSNHPAITQTLSGAPAQALIYAIESGHGWGANAENCAEFCNIAHHFGVNGQDFVRDTPQAGTSNGCANLVSEGVVPNQAGTWQYGRSGWCPGLDVKPFVADVTQAVSAGSNTFTYRALYQGQSYAPTAVSSPPQNAIGPSISLTSYLVIYAAPGSVSAMSSAQAAVSASAAAVANDGSANATTSPATSTSTGRDYDVAQGCAQAGSNGVVWLALGAVIVARARCGHRNLEAVPSREAPETDSDQKSL